MPRQAPTQSGHFSESEIDHFVMAITSADGSAYRFDRAVEMN
jgi:hypothetical protein